MTVTTMPDPTPVVAAEVILGVDTHGDVHVACLVSVLGVVDWFNTERTHESIDDLTPVAAEELHYRYHAHLAEAGWHQTKPPDSPAPQPNRSNPTGKISGWKSILNTLAITYGDRPTIN
jgi:hypothetical protein